MSTVAKDFGMDEAMKILGLSAINEGTSTGQKNFGNGEIIESHSPVDGQLIGKAKLYNYLPKSENHYKRRL